MLASSSQTRSAPRATTDPLSGPRRPLAPALHTSRGMALRKRPSKSPPSTVASPYAYVPNTRTPPTATDAPASTPRWTLSAMLPYAKSCKLKSISSSMSIR